MFQPGTEPFAAAEAVRVESVVTVTGNVVARSAETVNPTLPTGEVELVAEALAVDSAAETLPLQVNSDRDYPGGDAAQATASSTCGARRCRRTSCCARRSSPASARRMHEQGFIEFQTPILTASSPEGARDFLVPSRLHPGSFYALPQAPQQYKQLYMISGFDRYFQIAPCFRDEDARADRSPGEFYQLDIEMSFVTQEDVFAAVEPVMHGLFAEFSSWEVTPTPFPRLAFREAHARYGTDKPDLRNPIEIADVTEVFRGSGFKVFAGAIEKGAVVRAIPAPGAVGRPRSFFDQMVAFAQSQGAPGLGWIALGEGEAKGPIAKFLDAERLAAAAGGGRPGDRRCRVLRLRPAGAAAKLAGLVRTRVGEELGLIAKRLLPVLLDRRLPDVRVGRGEQAGRPSRTTRSRCRRVGWRRCCTRIRCRSWPTSTTSSATASS